MKDWKDMDLEEKVMNIKMRIRNFRNKYPEFKEKGIPSDTRL